MTGGDCHEWILTNGTTWDLSLGSIGNQIIKAQLNQK